MLSDYPTLQDLEDHALECLKMLEEAMNKKSINTYSETLLLIKNEKGIIFDPKRRHGDDKGKFLQVDDVEELLAVVEIIEKLHPNIQFELENDTAVGWCRYKVTRKVIIYL